MPWTAPRGTQRNGTIGRKSTLEQNTLQPLHNPFGTRLSPMSSERSVTYVSGPDIEIAGDPGRTRTCDQELRRLWGIPSIAMAGDTFRPKTRSITSKSITGGFETATRVQIVQGRSQWWRIAVITVGVTVDVSSIGVAPDRLLRMVIA
jgi:hypothetical protein